MASHELDYLIMLLSADWFFPHWGQIGINVTDDHRSCMRDGCRDITRQFMSGAAQYWNVDSTPERIEATRSDFENLLRRCNVSQDARERIRELTSAEELPLDSSTRWLLIVMTEQLLQGSADAPEMDPIVTEGLSRQYDRWRKLRVKNLTNDCLGSASMWDEYLRDLTPRLRSMLADRAAAFVTEDNFKILWEFIHAELTAEQRSDLLRWYRSRGQVLTGEPIRLPEVA